MKRRQFLNLLVILLSTKTAAPVESISQNKTVHYFELLNSMASCYFYRKDVLLPTALSAYVKRHCSQLLFEDTDGSIAYIKGALRWKIPFPAQCERSALVGKCREQIGISFKYFVVVSYRQCALNLRENRLKELSLHIYCHIYRKVCGSRLCGRTADG
jgi:hypothetical protein